MRFINHQRSLSFNASALKKPFAALSSKLFFHSKDSFFNSKIYPDYTKEIDSTNSAAVALETASVLSRDNGLFHHIKKYHRSSSSSSESNRSSTTTVTTTGRKYIKNFKSCNSSIKDSKHSNINAKENNDTRAAAYQIQPTWTTFSYKRVARQNSRYLLEIATGYQNAGSAKTNNAIRQRKDEFVWGRSSPLRSVSVSL